MNCTRLKSSFSARASVLTVSVFASPGAPSSSTCPPHSRPMNTRSIISSWPTITLWTSVSRRSTKALSRSTMSLTTRIS